MPNCEKIFGLLSYLEASSTLDAQTFKVAIGVQDMMLLRRVYDKYDAGNTGVIIFEMVVSCQSQSRIPGVFRLSMRDHMSRNVYDDIISTGGKDGREDGVFESSVRGIPWILF